MGNFKYLWLAFLGPISPCREVISLSLFSGNQRRRTIQCAAPQSLNISRLSARAARLQRPQISLVNYLKCTTNFREPRRKGKAYLTVRRMLSAVLNITSAQRLSSHPKGGKAEGRVSTPCGHSRRVEIIDRPQPRANGSNRSKTVIYGLCHPSGRGR